MGQWQPKRINPHEINGGNEFQGGEPLNNRDFNAVYENALKDAEMLDNMKMQLDGENNVGPSVSITYDPITNIPTLHFKNTLASPFWLSNIAPTNGTILITKILNPSNVRGFMAGDLVFITSGVEQGNFYRIVSISNTTLNVNLLTTLRGIRGTSIFTTSAELKTSGNAVITVSTIDLPNGDEIRINDLLISINYLTAGVIGKVTTINGSSITVSFVNSLGDTFQKLVGFISAFAEDTVHTIVKNLIKKEIDLHKKQFDKMLAIVSALVEQGGH